MSLVLVPIATLALRCLVFGLVGEELEVREIGEVGVVAEFAETTDVASDTVVPELKPASCLIASVPEAFAVGLDLKF